MSNKSVINIKPLGFPWQTSDPFLFCAYHADNYPQGNVDLGPASSLAGRNLGQDFTIKDGWRMYHGRTVPGFPAHPHVGFETVTIATKGLVDHADSLGAAGRFGNGDVQWMTAGKGVQHSEMFPLLDQENGNELELFQIWLNLPQRSKKVDPHFAMLWADKVPKLKTEDQAGNAIEVSIIAGQIGDLQAPNISPDSWAGDPDNEVNIWIVKLAPSATWTIPTAKHPVNRNLYFYNGNAMEIDGTAVAAQHSIELKADQANTLVNGDQPAALLLLQGRPINEPVVQHGPFVANSQEGIVEAYQEFQRTQFGGWPWARPDQVHGSEKGRFAKYVDGVVEEKEA